MAEAIFQLGQKALIINEHDEVLMVAMRSSHDPKLIWHDFPGGRVDQGEEEDLPFALKRELQEELQVEVEIHDLLTLSVGPPSKSNKHRVALAVYHCSIAKGEPKPDNEVLSFEWVPIDMVPKLPYTRYTKDTIQTIKKKLAL